MKVKVKGTDLVGLLHRIKQGYKDGTTTPAKAAQVIDGAKADGLFDDFYERGRGLPNGSEGPIRWMAGSAQRPTKDAGGGAGRFGSGQEVFEALIGLEPGSDEIPQVADGESKAKLALLHRIHDTWQVKQAIQPGWSPRHSKYARDYRRLAGELVSKILTTGGAATGAEFVPTILSGDLIPLWRLQLRIAGLFEHFGMVTKTVDVPLEGADVESYFVAEASDDNALGSGNIIPARTPATAKVTFTAKAFKTRGVSSEEAEEDAIFSLIDYIRRKLVEGHAQALENALINGDTTATHMDSDVTAATDARKAFNGLRKLSNAAAQFNASAGKLTGAMLLNVRAKFGKFADPTACMALVSPIGLTHLIGDSNFLTMSNDNVIPTIISGQLGMVLGMPVVLSPYIREDLGSTGVYSASATRTQAIVVHRPSFWIGDRRQITIESMKEIQSGRYVTVSTWRGDFQRVQSEITSGTPLSRNVGFVFNINKDATF